MVGPWHRRKACHVRISPHAGLPSSKTRASRRMSSNRTRTSSWRTWSTPSVCAWEARTGWHSMAWRMGTASVGRFAQLSCAGTCQLSLRGLSTLQKASWNQRWWKLSSRPTCCKSLQAFLSGPLVPVSSRPRCHQPASWWQTVVTADVCWRNREPLVISPPTTTSKVRRRRSSGGCLRQV
ncbi:unnamed protein product, partial [Symbiodinium microadriaticum]